MQTYDIIIVGGGPAGLTAAIYARRNGKSVLLLEKEGFGGQIAYAPRVENYPGVGAVSGAELRVTPRLCGVFQETLMQEESRDIYKIKKNGKRNQK